MKIFILLALFTLAVNNSSSMATAKKSLESDILLQLEDEAFFDRMLQDAVNSMDPEVDTPIPVEAGSAAPTQAPSKEPRTLEPSAVPSFEQAQKSVTLDFEAILTLEGLNVFDVPINEELTEFLEAIAGSVEAVWSNATNSIEVQVKTVDSLPVRGTMRRRLRSLQASVDVGIEVTAVVDCFRSDCVGAASDLFFKLQMVIEQGIDSGALTSSIRSDASTRGVTALEQSTVVKATFGEASVQVEDVDDEDDSGDGDGGGGEDGETSGAVGTQWTKAAAVAVALAATSLAI